MEDVTKARSSSCIFCTIDGNTRGQHRSTNNSFFWNTFSCNTIQQDSINFLSLKVSVRDIACMNGNMSLCTPTANNIVRIHITSWGVCAKFLGCLEISATNQSVPSYKCFTFPQYRDCTPKLVGPAACACRAPTSRHSSSSPMVAGLRGRRDSTIVLVPNLHVESPHHWRHSSIR